MVQPYPLPRQTRETTILDGDGGATYGPFGFQIFDEEDVVVLVRTDEEDSFERRTDVTVNKTTDDVLSHFTITFEDDLPETSSYIVRAERVHERSIGVGKGTAIGLDALEREFSKQTTVLQELRRDNDQALRVPPGLGLPFIEPPQNGRVLTWDTSRPGFPRIKNGPSEAAIDGAADAASIALQALEDIRNELFEAFGRVPISAFGPIDGPTQTLAFANACASGMRVFVPAGDYYVDPIDVTTRVDFLFDQEAKVFLNSVSTDEGARSVIFNCGPAASFSKFYNGTLDGQRSLFEADYPDYGRTADYVTWEGIRGDYCVGLEVKGMKFKNFMTMGLRHAGGDHCRFEHLLFENCGESYLISYARDIRAIDLVQRACGNGATPIFQHGAEVRFLENSVLEGLLCENFSGTAAGLEPIPIALSFNSCKHTTVRGVHIDGYGGDTLAIGMIWNAMEDCHLDDWRVIGFEIGNSLESPTGGSVTNGYVDGEYFNLSGLTYAGLNITIGGVFTVVGSGLAGESVGNQSAQDTRFSNIIVKRCGIGVRNDAPNVSFASVFAIGNLADGWQLVESAIPLQSHPGAQRRQTRSVVLSGCGAYANGGAGVIGTGGAFYQVQGGFWEKNGQDAAAFYRGGIVFDAEEAGELQNISVLGATVADDQGWVTTEGVSYRPGSTDAENCYWFRLKQPYRVHDGQRIRLKGIGAAGADLDGKIVDREVDDVRVKFSAPQTILAGSNLRNIGNGSSSGVILTGEGTSWLSAFTFANWVKHPTLDEYRLISYVNSNTEIVLSSAFSAAIPAGSALQVIRANVEGIRSQQQGIRLTSDVEGPVLIRDNTVAGNVAADYVFDFPALSAVRAGSEFSVAFSTALSTSSDITTLVTGIPFGYKIDALEIAIDTTWTGFDGGIRVDITDGGSVIHNAIAAWPVGLTAGQVARKLTAECPAFDTNGAVLLVFHSGADNFPSAGAATITLRLRKIA